MSDLAASSFASVSADAATASGGGAAAAPPPLPAVGVEGRAFTIDGRPALLLAAEIDVADVPRERWDAWAAWARRGGMNAAALSGADPAADDRAAFRDACARQGLAVVDGRPAGARAVVEGADPAEEIAAAAAGAGGGPVAARVVRAAAGEDGGEAAAYAVWRCLAAGAAGVIVRPYVPGAGGWHALRRVALFARTFGEVLAAGEHKARRATDPRLRVTETATRERGSVLWVDNPGGERVEGAAVPPYLPDVTLGPRSLLPWVHEFPIGATHTYMGAYAGLVKSDAPVLDARLLPDPYEGVRVIVYGEPGEEKEVVLFQGGQRGRGVTVTFDPETPRVYALGESQIVAVTTAMAGRTFFHPTDENAPVLFGPEDVLAHDAEFAEVVLAPGRQRALLAALLPNGELTDIAAVDAPPDPTASDFDDSAWPEIDDLALRGALTEPAPFAWYRAEFESPEETEDSSLHFAGFSGRLTVWANGERAGETAAAAGNRDAAAELDIPLRAGRNVLAVLWEAAGEGTAAKRGLFGPATVLVPGACYLIDVARWRREILDSPPGAAVTVALGG